MSKYLLQFQLPLQIFKSLVEALNEINKEICFVAKKDKIKVSCMDMSLVCLAELFMNNPLFSVYKINPEEGKKSVKFGIHMPSILKILQNIPSSGNVLCYIDKNHQDKLTIVAPLDKDKGSQVTFDLTLISVDALNLEIPETEYDATIQMIVDDFAAYMKTLSSFSTEIEINIKKDGKSMKWNTSEESSTFQVTQGNIYLKNMENIKFSPTVCKDFEYKEKFSLKYMLHFLKAKNLFSHIDLCFTEEQPLRISNTADDRLSMKFFLAPKQKE